MGGSTFRHYIFEAVQLVGLANEWIGDQDKKLLTHWLEDGE